ncbi:hypothetical protein D9M68_670980 [compost metagenome]
MARRQPRPLQRCGAQVALRTDADLGDLRQVRALRRQVHDPGRPERGAIPGRPVSEHPPDRLLEGPARPDRCRLPQFHLGHAGIRGARLSLRQLAPEFADQYGRRPQRLPAAQQPGPGHRATLHPAPGMGADHARRDHRLPLYPRNRPGQALFGIARHRPAHRARPGLRQRNRSALHLPGRPHCHRQLAGDARGALRAHQQQSPAQRNGQRHAVRPAQQPWPAVVKHRLPGR